MVHCVQAKLDFRKQLDEVPDSLLVSTVWLTVTVSHRSGRHGPHCWRRQERFTS